MADKETQDYIVKLQEWMLNSRNSITELSNNRNWCILGIEDSLLEKTLKEYFTRGELAKQYKDIVEKGEPSNDMIAFLQLESDIIFGLHRCFAVRHRSRLSSYRDDSAQKEYHIPGALDLAMADMILNKERN